MHCAGLGRGYLAALAEDEREALIERIAREHPEDWPSAEKKCALKFRGRKSAATLQAEATGCQRPILRVLSSAAPTGIRPMP